jgi:hypothetical protein
MATRVTYIDDEAAANQEAQRIAKALNLEGEFECELRPPPRDFADIPVDQMDALLVDLDLSSATEGSDPVSYLGSTLASEVRMRNPACPIILVTRPNITAAEQWQKQYLIQNNALDLIIDKDNIIQDPAKQRAEIISLAKGFKALEKIVGKDWEKALVLGLMKATDSEANQLREAAPPVSNNQWNVPQAARWIRDVIMEFPGILYDKLTAATRLGITVNSFREARLQEMLDSARYKGVFGEHRERWWRGRLFNTARRLMMETNTQGPVSESFREAFRLKFGQDLEPTVCVVDNTPTADWVCYILNVPVKQEHSIPYYPDTRPPVMDQARVSFTAIRTSNAFDENLVDADSYDLVQSLWEEDANS